MLENYGKDAQITAMVDRFNWVILPLLNPDGYAYTWKSVSHVAVGKSRDHDVGETLYFTNRVFLTNKNTVIFPWSLSVARG